MVSIRGFEMPELILTTTRARLRCAEEPEVLAAIAACRYVDPTTATGFRTLWNSGDFPIGLAPRVQHDVTGSLLRRQARGEVEIQDSRLVVVDESGYTPSEIFPTNIPLRTYQREMYNSILSRRRGSVMAVTRAGKTRVACAVTESLRHVRPALFLVDRSELGAQTATEIRRLLGESVLCVGDGKGKLEDGSWIPLDSPKINDHSIIVAMRQTLSNYLDLPWLSKIRLAWVDEHHHVVSKSNRDILEALTGCHRLYGLSGTPWSNDGGLDLLIEAYVGPVICRVTYTQLMRTLNPETQQPYLCPPVFVYQRMPRYAGDKDAPWQDHYKAGITTSVNRNRAIIEFAKWCLKEKLTCVITVDEVDHGLFLAEHLKCPMTAGSEGTSGKKSPYLVTDRVRRQEVLDQLKSREIPIVVSTLYKEAIDIPSLDCVVKAGGKKSTIAFYQELRNLTGYPGKKVAIVLDFEDRGTVIGHWAYQRKRMAENEPEFRVISRTDYLSGGKGGVGCWDWLKPAVKNGIREIDRIIDPSAPERRYVVDEGAANCPPLQENKMPVTRETQTVDLHLVPLDEAPVGWHYRYAKKNSEPVERVIVSITLAEPGEDIAPGTRVLNYRDALTAELGAHFIAPGKPRELWRDVEVTEEAPAPALDDEDDDDEDEAPVAAPVAAPAPVPVPAPAPEPVPVPAPAPAPAAEPTQEELTAIATIVAFEGAAKGYPLEYSKRFFNAAAESEGIGKDRLPMIVEKLGGVDLPSPKRAYFFETPPPHADMSKVPAPAATPKPEAAKAEAPKAPSEGVAAKAAPDAVALGNSMMQDMALRSTLGDFAAFIMAMNEASAGTVSTVFALLGMDAPAKS